MSPVTISGSNQGMMMSERPTPPRKPEETARRGKSRLRKWPRRDPKVNSNVWTMAVRVVGSSRMKR